MSRTRQQVAADKPWTTIRSRKAQGLTTLKNAKRRCKQSGGHTFDGPDDPDKCVHCGTPRAPSNVFARLAYVKWWDDSMRATWRGIAVAMGRGLARDKLRDELESQAEPDFSSVMVRREWILITELAMVDHKLRHPNARGDRLWIYLREEVRTNRAQVLCRFCRRVLVEDAPMGIWHTADHEAATRQHTYLCAATTLVTGSSTTPAKPKTKTRKGSP